MPDGPMSGAPALLRALAGNAQTLDFALALLETAHGRGPKTAQDIAEIADALDERLAEDAWRRRRESAMTDDR